MMMRPSLFVATLLILVLAAMLAALQGEARAQPYYGDLDEAVRVCPGGTGAAPPDFTNPACETTSFYALDPQGREIWVEIEFDMPPPEPAGTEPLGLFLSGKASSTAYLNGVHLGANGRPASDRANEQPGRMDAVFYVPSGALMPGRNRLVLHLSGHHSLMTLGFPMHGISLRPYRDPTARALSRYWPALVTFGVLLAGALAFAVAAFAGAGRKGAVMVSVAALFASLQLAAESWRGLVAYAYPLHDVRLLAITAFAALAGSALASFAWSRVYQRGFQAVFIACLIMAAAVSLLAPGFDLKAVLAIMLPLVFVLGTLVPALIRRNRRAIFPALVLSGFTGTVLFAPNTFLDQYFFQLMAALVVIFFANGALTLGRERTAREAEQGRARRLEAALALAEARHAPARLPIVSAGRVDLVDTARLVRCQGAGDYVELYLDTGQCLLHTGTLNALETRLPANFVRVHRSHLVNIATISALDRDEAGTGTLILNDGHTVPVSRRIMPKIRHALKTDAPTPQKR